ncbi:MAG: DUF1573 domain-containing protein [Flavobacteriaceae bacterium]|nr:DUF1573 domain-containing protein [Flavobacteriaceae bacterium]MCB0484705.1 DUF1573 domain-containing protein [Flavobacteriaceae bacterium]
MKKIVFILFLGLVGLKSYSQEPATAQKIDENAPIFKFEKELLDYGSIEKDSDGKRVFEFTNVGKSPLIITNIKSSCGCTVPKRPEQPIMPGEKGQIEVVYATHKVGVFSKRITIFSNASEPTKVVSIKGNVKPESSLSLLERLEKKEKSMLENQ